MKAIVGQFVYPHLALVSMNDADASENVEKIRECFVTGKVRTFDEDPRFGFIVISEIGSKALSPATNNPGTAIQVISSLVRLILFTRKDPKVTSMTILKD